MDAEQRLAIAIAALEEVTRGVESFGSSRDYGRGHRYACRALGHVAQKALDKVKSGAEKPKA